MSQLTRNDERSNASTVSFLESLNFLWSDDCAFTLKNSPLPFLCTLRFHRDNGVHGGFWKFLREIPFLELSFPYRDAVSSQISIHFALGVCDVKLTTLETRELPAAALE